MKPRTWTPAKLIPIAEADWDSKFDEAQYHSAAALTTRPQPLSTISVPYPKDVQQGGAWSALLAIFIDEDGAVVRVNVLSAKLPLPFEEAAVNTFGSARFRPGRIGDKPVKSRMVIEVLFENAPEIARDTQLTVAPVSIEKSAAKP
jgi:outer membrane biosynthesis protein TonB